MVGWLVGRFLVVWLAGCWLAGYFWLVIDFVGWLFVCLVGWLVDWDQLENGR